MLPPGVVLRSLHLLYHELRPTPSRYSYVIECGTFEKQIDFFAMMRSSDCGLRPEVTFDDGHLSDYEYALPILQSRGIQARFFITTGWTQQRAGYMGWRELRGLQEAGQFVGAHGWTHRLLTHCTTKDLELELVGARKVLEDHLGTAITTVSLPGGRFNKRVLGACQEAGYTEVFTSIPRVELLPLGPLVGRLNIRAEMSLAWLSELLQGDGTLLASARRHDGMKRALRALLGDRLYASIWSLVNRKEPEVETNSGEASQR